jgi:hypothetical protein
MFDLCRLTHVHAPACGVKSVNPGLSSKIFKDCCTPDAGAELSFEPRRFVKAAKGRLFTVADR